MLKINYMIPHLWMRSDPNGFEKLKISFIVVKICIKNNGAERERESSITFSRIFVVTILWGAYRETFSIVQHRPTRNIKISSTHLIIS